MLLHYLKYSPTGNITVLVTTPVPRPEQPGVASRLLEAVGGEQVGFIEPAADPRCPARLQMMGGEFCGNATMSLGAMLARERDLTDGEALDLMLEVSGLDAPVPCRITGCPGDGSPDAHPLVGAALRRPPSNDRSPVAAPSTAPSQILPPVGKAAFARQMTDEVSPLLGTVQMPLPLSIGDITLPADAGPLTARVVALPGITHLILPADTAPGEAELRRRLPAWNRTIGADALGALRFDAAGPSIDPLVYVPSVGSLVREHGCGSGTAAVGCHLAATAGRDVQAPVAQPGGTIAVRAAFHNGRVTALAITGRVALLEEGDFEI